jgi:hypothetical protein
MTPNKFIDFVENLYGKYSEAWKIWIRQYLNAWDEHDIDDLFQYLIIRHKFNTPPNLAVIEDARREYITRFDRSLGKEWKPAKPKRIMCPECAKLGIEKDITGKSYCTECERRENNRRY